MIKKVISISLLTLICVPLSITSQPDQVEEIFTDIFEQNKWFSQETVSGQGSELKVTRPIRAKIGELVEQFDITSFADAPCGDFNWMKMVDLGSCRYVGIDIVKAIVEQNTRIYANPLRTFKHLNVIEDTIDKVDLILCRDLLAHLTYAEIYKVLKNFKKSGSKYLLATTNNKIIHNNEISQTGGWRMLNLERHPFNFPKPLALIEEDVPYECERGKHLGLWRLEDILNG